MNDYTIFGSILLILAFILITTSYIKFKWKVVTKLFIILILLSIFIAFLAFILGKSNLNFKVLVIVVPLGVAVLICSVVILNATFLKPITIINQALQNSITNQTLTVKINFASEDEFGIISRNLDRLFLLFKNIVEKSKDSAHTTKSLNTSLNSNMTETATATEHIAFSVNNLNPVLEKQNQEIQLCVEAVASQKTALADVDTAIQNVITANKSLEKTISTQSSASTELAATVEEISANIKSVADISVQADTTMNELNKATAKSLTLIKETSQATGIVRNSVETIEAFAALVTDIANQTNLLAMNAAIEAAHAGDAGRGFAVVAEEIRKLSDRSNDEARKVKEAITVTINAITTGADNGNKTEIFFNSVTELSKKVTEIIGSVRGAMNEQSNATVEMLKAVQELSENAISVSSSYDSIANGISIITNKSTVLEKVSQQTESAMSKLVDISNTFKTSIVEVITGTETIDKQIKQMKVSSVTAAKGAEELVNNLNEFKTDSEFNDETAHLLGYS